MSSILESINNWISGIEPTRVDHPGLVLRWTGFKAWPDNSILAGQWLAIPTSEEARAKMAALDAPPWGGGGEQTGVYSSTPGVVAPYAPGHTFNLQIQEGQTFLQVSDFESDPTGDRSAPDVAKRACLEAKAKLEAYLRHHGILPGV
jgi:hypothetical protein